MVLILNVSNIRGCDWEISVQLMYYSKQMPGSLMRSWATRTCCVLLSQDAYSEVASLFAEFFRDLDIVPSDIIAGLVLLRQRQRAKRSAILDQVRPE